MIDLNAIAARLGSLSPAKLNTLPPSVLRLLEEDLPAMIAENSRLRRTVEQYGEALLGLDRIRIAAASVLSEEGVKEHLLAYVMGCELINLVEVANQGVGHDT